MIQYIPLIRERGGTADAADLKSAGATCGGSNPPAPTTSSTNGKVMESNIFEDISSQFSNVTTFLFDSYMGVAILIAIFLLLTLIIAILLEFKTQKKFKSENSNNNEKTKTDI